MPVSNDDVQDTHQPYVNVVSWVRCKSFCLVSKCFGNQWLNTERHPRPLPTTATISNGLMMCSIGRLMSEKLDVLRMTFYTAPVTIFVLLPFYFRMEAAAYQE